MKVSSPTHDCKRLIRPPRLRFHAGLDKIYPPVRMVAVDMLNDAAIGRVDSEVSGTARVLHYPALYVVTFVAGVWK